VSEFKGIIGWKLPLMFCWNFENELMKYFFNEEQKLAVDLGNDAN